MKPWMVNVELGVWYALVSLTLVSCLVQIRNVQRARDRKRAALGAILPDEDRTDLAAVRLRLELYRLITHVGVFVTGGYALLIRYVPAVSGFPPLVNFFVEVGGIALVPVMLLIMSWDAMRVEDRIRDRGRDGARIAH